MSGTSDGTGTRCLPLATPFTRTYWKSAARGKFLIVKCSRCERVHFPPRPFCPLCQCRDIEWTEASGKATLYSYVINEHPPPGWGDDCQSVALVKLREGPMMVSCIVECAQKPDALVLDMPLEVCFRPLTGEIALPVFRPAQQASHR